MPDHHSDPFIGHEFLVSLGDLGGEDQLVGGFHEVEGIGASIDVVEYRTGNERVPQARKLPGLRRFTNVTLKRGLIMDLRLWDWINGYPPEPRVVTITLLDQTRTPTIRFTLQRAWPCRWSGPHLHASSSLLAVESIELCHEGLQVHVL